MSRSRRNRMAGAVAVATALVLTASQLPVGPANADPAKPAAASTSPAEKPGNRGVSVKGLAWQPPKTQSQSVPAPVWPKAGTTTIDVSTNGTGPVQVHPGAAQLGTAAAPARATVQVLDRSTIPAPWRDGVVTRISAAAASGPATVTLDYSAFEHAYGADWASRLRLYQLPACALSTPAATACSAVALPSQNNEVRREVSAPVTLAAAAQGGTLVALAAAVSGDSGDFSATPLSASATWSAGGNAGDFSWSYPMRTPQGAGGPSPKLSLAYASSSVDGRSEATNNQPSIIGEGFDMQQGFIERSYQPCSEDNDAAEEKAKGKPNTPTVTGDLCWHSWNATMTLDGKSSPLVPIAAKAGDAPTKYRARTETGDVIERLTGAVNGDNDGEYWKVTANDGTQYFFGRNKLPGQSNDTTSAWTVPVYGNHPSEPCHGTTFADSGCAQTWRWNLDYIVDRNGNTESLWYDKETNQYAARAGDTNHVTYDRGGFLKRIDYDTWDRLTADGKTDRSIDPAAQVTFTPSDRCLSDCSTHDEAHWPDTPWDQECKSTATSCPRQYSPSFWTTKRLAAVTTRVWDTTKSPAAWQDVDKWTLTHTFPRSGDGTHRGLWLGNIVHSGEVGTSTAMPPIYFYPQSMANRVLTDSNTTLNWQRLNQIRTESGELITISYNGPECTDTTLPSNAATNTMRCYPTIGPDPQNPGHDRTEWWHKYTVSEVSQADLQLANHEEQPTSNTYYEYEGKPAWHYADADGLTKTKRLTWNQWRGYQAVAVRVGDTQQTLTRTTYMRGMDGDRAATSGGTRDVTVPATLGSEVVRDSDVFAGMPREQTVYNGSTDKPLTKTVNVPWQSAPTTSQTIGDDKIYARYVNTQTVYAATSLGEQGERGWRTTKTHSSFDDDYGTTLAVDNSGDIDVTGDEKCTATTYNRNAALNIVTLPKRVVQTALACGKTPTSLSEIVDDQRISYDNADSADTAPTIGAVSKTEQMQDWTPAAGTVYQTTSTTKYDAVGREISSTDIRNNATTTAYTPPGRGPVTSVKTTNVKGWTNVTVSSPYWGTPVRVTDTNARSADEAYDALGRLVAVWDTGWPRASHKNTPSTRYSYCFQPDPSNNPACQTTTKPAYTYVKTEALTATGTYQVSYQIFDAMLRLRQTQSTTPNRGERIVTETQYDSWGRPEYTISPHAEAGDAAGVLLWTPVWSNREVTQTVYDQANRTTNQILLATNNVDNLIEKWRTTTRYAGDRTMVTPPSGGTPTTTITDAGGRTTQLREHSTVAGVDGAYQATDYHYNAKDQLESVEDALHNSWQYTYDARGRQHSVKDPDKGASTTEYNQYGDVTTTTDATPRTLVYKYDTLGRKTGVYDDTISDATQRASWTYDKLPDGTTVKGQLAASTRFDASHNAYTTQVESLNLRYQPLQVSYHLPAAEGVGTAWSISYGYADTNGAPTDVLYPGVTGMPQENVTTKYDDYSGLPVQLTSLDPSVGTYVSGQTYSSYGEPVKTVRQRATGQRYEELYDYDYATRRLHNTKVTSGTLTNQYSNRTYAYNPIGDIVAETDAPTSGAADTQCFTYDALRRLSSAWTPTPANATTTTPDTDCKATPTAGTLGGAAPYWSDWTFDEIGNRRTETNHKAGGDTTLSYAVPPSGPNTVRPHAVTSVTADAPQSATAYGYDATGNMTTRPGQTLTWDTEGHLGSVTDPTGKTSYLYDADGGRLLQRDPTGTTLYLPGLEIRHDTTAATGTYTETRYYAFAGQKIAQRKSSDPRLTWLFSDNHGTEQLSVDDLTGRATIRRQTPYGSPRGADTGLWPTTKGFVGGDLDPTSLTHLGAREYDPAIGRFISVDPVQDLNDSQQWNGYAYAGNNPITFADPSGLIAARDSPGGTSCGDACQAAISAQYRGEHTTPSTKKKDSAPKRYWGALTGNLKGFVTETLGTAMDGGGCVVSLAACKRQWDRGVQALTFANDLVGCVMFMMDYCANVDRSVGCPDGFTAECAGNLTAVGVEIAVTHKLGKLGPVAAADGEALAAETPKSPVRAVADDVGCSFDPATLVLMADGTTKPIKSVAVGDKVVSTDPEDPSTETKTVEALHDNLDINLADLVVTDSQGHRNVIHTTQNHPFWDATSHQWLRVGQLHVGDRLLPTGENSRDGFVKIAAVRPFTQRRHMLNLTIRDFHTYYVMAGTTPVLVHNTGPGCGSLWMNPDKLPHHYMRTSEEGVMHAADFGVSGPYNKANGQAFIGAVERFTKSPGTVQVRGSFRGQDAIHYVDPDTGLHASFAANGPSVGEYLGGWKSGGDQLTYLLQQGKL